MTRMTFQPANRLTSAALGELFTRAYSDYFVPVNVDRAAFELMVMLYDIDLSASRVGLLKGEPVALALLGVRDRRGWIGGMGVVPAYRGEGGGRAIMQAVIDSARRRKLRSIDLEVITENVHAMAIYDALGFERRRTLDIWLRDADATFPMPPRDAVQALEVAACLATHDELHSVTSPWQRDLPVLKRMAETLHAIGVREAGRIQSYVLYRMDGANVRIVDVAALPGPRTARIESMLRALIRDRSGSPVRFVNLPQDDPASPVMHRIGAQIEMQQHEMTLEISNDE